jgi:hypothetical protein
MIFFPKGYRTVGASVAVLCTLFSAGVVVATIPDCQDTNALRVIAPESSDSGEKLHSGYYRFKGRVTCSLTLPTQPDMVQRLKYGYGEFKTTEPGFTLQSENPDQPNGDWFFQGLMESTKPYHTWITYEYQITGETQLLYAANSLSTRGESYGANLKKEDLSFSLTLTTTAEKRSLWVLAFEREVQIDVPFLAPVRTVWSGVQKSVRESIEELAPKIHAIAGSQTSARRVAAKKSLLQYHTRKGAEHLTGESSDDALLQREEEIEFVLETE